MNTKSAILCIFEGEVRESKYFKTINNHYFDKNSILVCSYGNDIYELFNEINLDEDLDLIEILRESKAVPNNKEILSNYSRDDFGQIFLFFDFEYHDDRFNIQKLKLMLEAFNEETENGKLFVSYPMIEAIRDIPSLSDFIDHTVNLVDCHAKKYKKLSTKGLKEYQDPRKITKDQWDKLIEISIYKANYIITNDRNKCIKHPEQRSILSKQSDLIKSIQYIHVLGSFPLFIFHQKSSQLKFVKKLL